MLHTQCADGNSKGLTSREKCRATATFIENEFEKLSKEINEEREKMRRKKFRNKLNVQDTQDAYDTWKLTVDVWTQSWNPTEEREADLGEM